MVGATGFPQCRQGWDCPLRWLCPALLFWTSQQQTCRVVGSPGDSDPGPAGDVTPSLVGWLAVEAESHSGAAFLTSSKSGFGFFPVLSLKGGIQILFPIESSKPPGLCLVVGMPSSENSMGWPFVWNYFLPWPMAISSCHLWLLGGTGVTGRATCKQSVSPVSRSRVLALAHESRAPNQPH